MSNLSASRAPYGGRKMRGSRHNAPRIATSALSTSSRTRLTDRVSKFGWEWLWLHGRQWVELFFVGGGFDLSSGVSSHVVGRDEAHPRCVFTAKNVSALSPKRNAVHGWWTSTPCTHTCTYMPTNNGHTWQSHGPLETRVEAWQLVQSEYGRPPQKTWRERRAATGCPAVGECCSKKGHQRRRKQRSPGSGKQERRKTSVNDTPNTHTHTHRCCKRPPNAEC